jgi:hypothetical protein
MSGEVTKFTLNPNLPTIPPGILADGLVGLANDIRDELVDGQIVAVASILDDLRSAFARAEGDQRLLLQVAIAFLDAGFPGE